MGKNAMALPPPAEIGMPIEDVDTPALIVDLDAFERNLAKMARAVEAAGIRVRPHAKTHRSAVIAMKQMALGAVGVCCQKVSEAEAMVRGGVSNVLVSNEVAGRRKLERLAALARHAHVGVCVDDAQNVGELSRAAAEFGATLDVLVEIDVGANRCGVAPGEPALDLAKRIDDASSLQFAGLQAYQGRAQHIRSFEERRAAIDAAVAETRRTVDLLAENGLACDTVAGAGTGTHGFEAASGVYNELQPGSYIFMDADYARNLRQDGGEFDEFEHALFVQTTVMSTPTRERACVDAGLKAFSVDAGMPTVWEHDNLEFVRASDEHGVLAVAEGANVGRGAKLLFVPGHCDPTVNLHDWYIGVRGGRVEAIWPVDARGAGY